MTSCDQHNACSQCRREAQQRETRTKAGALLALAAERDAIALDQSSLLLRDGVNAALDHRATEATKDTNA